MYIKINPRMNEFGRKAIEILSENSAIHIAMRLKLLQHIAMTNLLTN